MNVGAAFTVRSRYDGLMKLSREEFLRLRAGLAALDPLLVAASDEVDSTLLQWARNLSPLQRLSAASRASAALHRFQIEPPPKAG
jgi:hypothetical protein